MAAGAPDEAGRGGGRRIRGIGRRLVLWLAVVVVVLPLVGLAAGNGFLNSGWGRDWLARKIESRCRLPVAVGSAIWLPWRGLALGGVEVAQPEGLGGALAEPLVRMEALRIQPEWRPLLRGKLDIRDIEVVRPRVVMAVEMMAALAGQGAEAVAGGTDPLAGVVEGEGVAEIPGIEALAEDTAAGGDVAVPGAGDADALAGRAEAGGDGAVPADEGTHPRPGAGESVAEAEASAQSGGQAAGEAGGQAGQASKGGAQAAGEAKVAKGGGAQGGERKPAAAGAAGGPAVVLEAPTQWLRVRSASVAVVSLRRAGALVEVGEVSGDLPLAGKAADSRMRLGTLQVGGMGVVSGLEFRLSWRAPVLTCAPVEVAVGGVKVQAAGQFGVLRGVPFQWVVQVPGQELAVGLPGEAGVIKAGLAGLRGQLQGYLLMPSTWQGECVGDASGVEAIYGGASAVFDRAHCGVFMRGGVLSCVDARLLGEELSFLGNGTVMADGRLAGVLRTVVPPGHLEAMVGRFFPGQSGPLAVTPLSTPQRVAFDLQVSGTVGEVQLQFGPDGPVLPLEMGGFKP